MDIFESRTSVRAFTDEPVAKSQVMALLRAAMLAPSACNQQPWRFYVIYDKSFNRRFVIPAPTRYLAQRPRSLLSSPM